MILTTINLYDSLLILMVQKGAPMSEHDDSSNGGEEAPHQEFPSTRSRDSPLGTWRVVIYVVFLVGALHFMLFFLLTM